MRETSGQRRRSDVVGITVGNGNKSRILKQDNQENIMKCNQEGCQHEAVFEMVWTKHQQYCPEHALKMINIGDAMGYPTARDTIRVLPEACATPEKQSQITETLGRMLLSGRLTEESED